MTLSDEQFKEWKTSFDPKTEIRVPKSRFNGLTGLANEFGIEYDTEDPFNTAEYIGVAAHHATKWAPVVEYPIDDLMAQHHIRRDNARAIFESIKSHGYDPNEPIRAVGDAWGATIINGHHRTIAALAAGMKTIPTELIDPEHLYRRLHGK